MQGGVQLSQYVNRTDNYLGTDATNTYFFDGDLCEVLMFEDGLTEAERLGVESYLIHRYAIVGPAPTITPGTGVYGSVDTVTITTPDPTATIYYTLNGTTPTTGSSVYSSPISISGSCTVKAIAYQTYGTSSVATAYIQLAPPAASVPTNSMTLWLKSDNGVVQSSGNVSLWADNSGSGNDATQSNSSYQPTLTSDTQNGLPSINFNGSSQYLQLPANLLNFGKGFSAFIVTSPANSGAGTIYGTANGSASDNVDAGSSGTTATASIYAGSSGSSLSASSALTLNQYQLLEVFESTGGTGSVSINGQPTASGSLNVGNNLMRYDNNIGTNYNASGSFFQGGLCEMLIYPRVMTTTETAEVESYLLSKYQISQSVPPAPIISIGTSSLDAPTQVTITAPADCSIRFTLDGTTPTSGSALYSSAINITYGQTLKAIAVRNGMSSTVSSATYTLDSTEWPAPSATDSTPLDFTIKVPSMSVPQ